MAIPIADAGTDQTFNFSALPTSANLTGGGTDPDLGAIITYLWELVEKPDGSTASLSSTSAQNPTLNNVDQEGTYLLFLMVEDDQNEWSDDNPLTAPESARVQINVRGPSAGLIKPAPGERGWDWKYHEAIDEIENLRGDVDAFSEAEADLTAFVVGTRLASGFNPLIVDVPVVTNESAAAAHWRTSRDIYVDEFYLQLSDAGESGAQWTISLYNVSYAEFIANTYGGGSQIATTVFTNSGSDHVPVNRVVPIGTPAQVDADRVLAVVVEDAPLNNGPPKDPGTGLSVGVKWRLRA